MVISIILTAEKENIPWKYKPRRVIERYGSRFLSWLVKRLSRESALKLGDFLADTAWVLLPRFKRLAVRMIETAFGDKYTPEERAKIAHRAYRSLVRTLIDFLRFPLYSKQDLFDLASEIIGWENMENALARSPGAVIGLAGHIGSWEFAGAMVPALGAPLIAMGREQREGAITKLLIESRTSVKIEHIPRSKQGTRKLIDCYNRKGSVVGLLADQNGGKSGIFLPFFGKMASNVRGPAYFALRYNLPIIPILAFWDGLKYKVIFGEEVEKVEHEDMEKAILLTTANVNKFYEKYISEYPDQWMWVHDRWKTRPPDETLK